MSLFRTVRRVDTNHAEIVGVLRAHGCSVQPVSAPGVPDLVVGLHGTDHWVEVKRPLGPRGGRSGRELNPLQQRWRSRWRGGAVWVLRSPADAVDWVRARIDEARGAA